MDKEREIKREVHRLLGYRAAFQERGTTWDGRTWERWIMLDPSDKVCYSEGGESEEDVWVSAIEHYGTAYEQSVDRALELPPPTKHAYLNQLAMWQEGGEWLANYAGALVYGDLLGRDKDLSIAICQSWIAYKRRQDLQ